MRKHLIGILVLLLIIISLAYAKDIKQATNITDMAFLVDSADHITGKTGATLTIYSSKNGGAWFTSTPTVTERGFGWYALVWNTSSTDTLGDFAVHITAASADPTDYKHNIVANIEADTYTRIGAPSGASVSADILSRLSWASYISPDNISITSIKNKTDNLPASPASEGNVTAWGSTAVAQINTRAAAATALDNTIWTTTRASYLDASIASRLGWSSYSAPDNVSITAIKVKTDNLPSDPADQSLLLAAINTVTGSGDVAVNHNTGGINNLQFTYQGVGIDDVTIKVYLKSDYDAGNISEAYVKGRSKTTVGGVWETPIYLDSGQTYTVVFYKQGYYKTSTKEVIIP